MIQLGGAFLEGFAIGPAMDAGLTRHLAGRGLADTTCQLSWMGK